MLSITSFALYGFPESHAASFALIAYASAYLKCHYLAAFTAALLNNQPMGFYRPATIVNDAQRHGLKIFPIDVMKSEWDCTVVGAVVGRQSSVVSPVVGRWSLAVGQKTTKSRKSGRRFRRTSKPSRGAAKECSPRRKPWVRHEREQSPGGAKESGLDGRWAGRPPDSRRDAGATPWPSICSRVAGRSCPGFVRQRNLAPFTSIHDLIHRVPELRKDELIRWRKSGR